MASAASPSSSSILCASFNQDNTCFSIGTREGFRIFDARTGRLCCERPIGALSVVEMLFSSNLLAIVGAGEQPSLSPRRLCLYNTITGAALRELNFLTSVLAVRLNRKRLIVVLQDKTYVYDSNTLAVLESMDTVPNPKGLCAFSPNSEGCYLALPASKTKGSVLVYNTMELFSLCQIDAHDNPLSAITFSSNGMYMGTASEQGTIIRVHLISQTTKSYNFRRGSYPSTIYSLSFMPTMELPDVLIATSSSGSVHAFFLRYLIDQKNKRSESFLGSMIPGKINNALEPTYHHVLHGAVPAGVRSYSMVLSMEKTFPSAASRASIFIINQHGHFREYSLGISKTGEPLWNLEHERNLLEAQVNNTLSVKTPA